MAGGGSSDDNLGTGPKHHAAQRHGLALDGIVHLEDGAHSQVHAAREVRSLELQHDTIVGRGA